MKIRHLLLSFTLLVSLFATSKEAQAEVDPRLKALGTMAMYGTVGGALLGTASLAFGTKGRSVAIGASLGLYAGLLFGGYVVVTHALKKRRFQQGGDYYPDSPATNPYENEGGADQSEGYPAGEEQSRIWQNFQEIQMASEGIKMAHGSGGESEGQSFGLPLLNIQF